MTPNTALDSTTGTEPNRSIRTASLTAGIALLLLSALSIFGFIVVVKGLVTPGDPAQTAKDITESSGLFRLGIAALYLVIPLDIVVGWALYRVFSPVSKSLSMLAATLRVAFAVVFMVAISRLVDVLRLLDNDSSLAAFSPEQLHTQALLAITAYNDVWHAGLFLFGLHLLGRRLPGVQVRVRPEAHRGPGRHRRTQLRGRHLRHRALPRHWTDTATFTFIGELLLGLWLVIRGRRLTLSASGPEGRPTSAPITTAR